jgi:hypothetical protein
MTHKEVFMKTIRAKQTIDESRSVLDSLPDRSADEVLRSLLARQAALQKRQRECQKHIDTIQQALQESRATPSTERFAQALMKDPTALVGNNHTLLTELDSLGRTLNGLHRASQQGQEEIMNRECELDGAACRAVHPLHRRNLRATINASLALQRSIVEQENLRLDLNARGVHRTSWLLAFAHGDFWTGPEDIHSWLSGQLRDLAGSEILTEAERLALQSGEIAELDLRDGEA